MVRQFIDHPTDYDLWDHYDRIRVPVLVLPNTTTPPILTAELVRYILPVSTNDLNALRAGLTSLGATALFALGVGKGIGEGAVDLVKGVWTLGSDAFKDYAQQGAQGVQQYADKSAGLMSRIDAPGMQRMGEGFSRGHLGTDVGLIAREASGQAFMDDLRLRSIRRNPWIDAAAQAMATPGLADRLAKSGLEIWDQPPERLLLLA